MDAPYLGPGSYHCMLYVVWVPRGSPSVRGQRWIQAIHGWPVCHFSTSTDGPGHPWILSFLACVRPHLRFN